MKLTGLFVRDCMSVDLITVTPDTELTRAVELMVRADVSGLVVIDAAGRLAGILTERDCIAAASAANYYGELGGPVAAFMSVPVETVGPDDSLIDVAARLAESPYRRFPVLDNGSLVGLLCRRDVMLVLGSGG